MSLNPHLITIAGVLAADGHSVSARDLRQALPRFSRRDEILQELTDQQWIIPTVADRYTLNDDRPGMDALKELLATTADTPTPPATADRHLSPTEQQQRHQRSVVAAADAKTLPFTPEPDDAPALLTQELRQRRRRIYRSMALPNQLEHQYQLLYGDLRHERGRDFIHLLGDLEDALTSLPAEHPDPLRELIRLTLIADHNAGVFAHYGTRVSKAARLGRERSRVDDALAQWATAQFDPSPTPEMLGLYSEHDKITAAQQRREVLTKIETSESKLIHHGGMPADSDLGHGGDYLLAQLLLDHGRRLFTALEDLAYTSERVQQYVDGLRTHSDEDFKHFRWPAAHTEAGTPGGVPASV